MWFRNRAIEVCLWCPLEGKKVKWDSRLNLYAQASRVIPGRLFHDLQIITVCHIGCLLLQNNYPQNLAG